MFQLIKPASSFLQKATLGILCLATYYCQAKPSVTVILETQKPGREIASDFVGLSFEMQRVLADTNGWHFFSAENTNLIATFQTLGIKNLRVGGNTADRPSVPVPSESDVDNLFAFARAANVKVIYTLRLNRGEMEAAVNMANYISRHYRDRLDCFAIGNEPNVFSKEYEPYLAEWKRYAAHITAPSNSPNATFCGPSTSPGHETSQPEQLQPLCAQIGRRPVVIRNNSKNVYLHSPPHLARKTPKHTSHACAHRRGPARGI